MEQLINGGTGNVEHGDFIHLRSRKVLTVAQDITPAKDRLLYTGMMVCISQRWNDVTVSGSLEFTNESLLNSSVRRDSERCLSTLLLILYLIHQRGKFSQSVLSAQTLHE